MSRVTVSERYFRQFARRASLPIRRIREGKGLSPDFYVRAPTGRRIVVEVKQFDPNQQEAVAHRAMLEGRPMVTGGVPGARLRAAIKTGGRQLRSRCKGKYPSLLVVYNNVISCGLHTDPYAVLTAMRGLDVIDYAVPANPAEPVRRVGHRLGGKRAMTEVDNTAVSAIGVLRHDFSDRLILLVFHNPHAEIPVTPDDVPRSWHYSMLPDKSTWRLLRPAHLPAR